MKIDDPNWIDDDLWKKYRDAIPMVPAVTWPKLIDYFQNEKSRNTGEPLQVASGLELTSNTVVLKAKVYSSNYFFV